MSRLGVALVAAAAFLGGVVLVAVLGVEDVVHERTVTRTVHDAATGGGGGSQSGGSGVPDVVGQPLDVARDALDQAGYDIQVEGGGVLGVIVAANWIVVSQDPPAGEDLAPGETVVLEIQRR